MKKIVFYLVIGAGLLIGNVASQNRTVVVRISLDSAGQVQVEPDSVEIILGDRVRWVTTDPGANQVEIEFADKNGTRGPFRSRDGGDNPSRGRYSKGMGQDITTAVSDREGEFEYDVSVTQ